MTEKRTASGAGESAKPQIEVKNVPLRVPGRQSLDALTRANETAKEKTRMPRLFARGSELVRIRFLEGGEISVQELDSKSIQYELSHVADYISTPGKGDPKFVFPPSDVCHYVLNATQAVFPPLVGTTRIPVFRADGTIVTERGYDDQTGLIYNPPAGFEVDVPERPKRPDVTRAVKVVGEVLNDFPWANKASLANGVALALTPFLREAIDGPVPLAALDKPTPGTGSTLLVESLALASTGATPGALGAAENDDEMRKALTSAFRGGHRWLFLDNIAGELKSASLARALTASTWEDRILGVSKTLRVPVKNVWVATGNNLQLSLEIARRSFWVRLDARMERPWEREREGFAHPDLRAYVLEHRAEIVSAMLTICRYWFATGRKAAPNTPTMGSFEAWSETLGGVLHAAKIPGFLENSRELYERAISQGALWALFLQAWRDHYGTEPVTAARVADDVQDVDELREVLPDEFSLADENLSRKLGRTFGVQEGVRFGEAGYHLAKAAEKKRTALWTVRRAGDESDETEKIEL